MTTQPLFFATYAVVASLTTANETVIATLPDVAGTFDSETVKLTGWANITTDGACTKVSLKIRRGTLTGTQVTPTADKGQTAAFAAGFVGDFTARAVDTPGAIPGATYVLTATAVANGGTCTVNAVCLEARVD